MQEKDIIKNLAELKNIKADEAWKASNREVLYSQISNNARVEESSFLQFFHVFARPAVLAMTVFLIVGGLMGGFAINAKPGDSLYIAKIISEKAQLAVTFDKDKKEKLEFKFASNRARDIADIISSEENTEKQAELSESFKTEIRKAREKIRNFDTKTADATEDETKKDENDQSEEEMSVFSAGFEKDDKGLQISETGEEGIEDIATGTPETATTTEESVENPINSNETDPEKILQEAEKLFENEDYESAKQKIDQANDIIENSASEDAVEVKGAEGSATSSNEEE